MSPRNKQAIAHDHSSSDSDSGDEKTGCSPAAVYKGFFTVFSFVKITSLIIFVVYSWVWTSNQREICFAVIS